MKLASKILLSAFLALSISSGQAADTGGKKNSPPDAVRKEGGCSKQKFKDAELAAYRALLEARAKAAKAKDNDITFSEADYRTRKKRRNDEYQTALNQAESDKERSAAREEFDKKIAEAQAAQAEGLENAQEAEIIADKIAQFVYDLAVADAERRFCKMAYKVSGTSHDTVYSGVIGDLKKPFTVNATGLAAFTLEFVPSSPTAGAVSYTASHTPGGAPTKEKGAGSYTVEGINTEKVRIKMNLGAAGTIAAGGRKLPIPSGKKAEIYLDLTPLELDGRVEK